MINSLNKVILGDSNRPNRFVIDVKAVCFDLTRVYKSRNYGIFKKNFKIVNKKRIVPF